WRTRPSSRGQIRPHCPRISSVDTWSGCASMGRSLIPKVSQITSAACSSKADLISSSSSVPPTGCPQAWNSNCRNVGLSLASRSHTHWQGCCCWRCSTVPSICCTVAGATTS
ncbi:uncharacterized protein METZ01_LOCUS396226, partial [marine metagenome]